MLKTFFNKPFFTNRKYIFFIWLILSVVSAILKYYNGSFNNFKIYTYVFKHTTQQLPLYELYPKDYFDCNHYGPLFSLIIAPFALLPDYIGIVLWTLFNDSVLIWAITKLPIPSQQINLILWICAHEFLTSTLSVQFNPIMTAIILLTFIFIGDKKDIWATFMIVVGTYIKLYGIVGLAFFLFSKEKKKFILWGILWSVVLFVLPMIISSPQFIMKSYSDWYNILIVKNEQNVSLNSYQDISVMGMIRRFLGNSSISNLIVLIPGVLLFSLPFLNINKFSNPIFKLLTLASVLIFTVIFSSGSESPTYIIAVLGVAIWFVVQPIPLSITNIILFTFAIVITCFSPSDLFPKYIRETYIIPYALKALPCLLIWLKIIYEMINFDSNHYIVKENG